MITTGGDSMDLRAREEYCTFLVEQSLVYIKEAQEKYELKIKCELSDKETDIFRHAFIAGCVSVGIFLTDDKRGD
jgi:hypothetical protein